MFNKGILSLYRRDRREREGHYRIIDDKLAMVEKWHESLEQLSLRDEYQYGDVGSCTKHFDRYLKIQDVVKSKNPLVDFLVLSPSEIEALMSQCLDTYPGEKFSDLSERQIREEYIEMKSNWPKTQSDWIHLYKSMKSHLDKAPMAR